jgi:membrane-associated phospholipid phosphatase
MFLPSLFLLGPKNMWWLDATSMVLFGLGIGALICYLGGLMAVDIVSKKASGAALGIVGIMSYAAAGIQDIASGYLINNSFPSGHAATTFYSAGFIYRRYGSKYSIPAYVFAGFAAASRIDSKKHDIFDVLIGATIGLGSNLLFTKSYEQKHMELTFNSNKGDYLLGFTYVF